MHQQTMASLAADLAQKKISSIEVTQHYLDRIEKWNKTLNCFITVCPELALKQAKAADEMRAKGQAHALTGVPIAQKDLFCTYGVKTSCGSKMLDNFIAPYNATLVERCQQSGMVLLGKTNLDEFGMGSSNENSYYGPVKNPWDLQKVAGGSSGGSSAAVAAGLAPIATGTDTGGSIRQPAALCGLTGLKPTYGAVSRYGMIAFASSLDQGGPMGQTAEDCAMLMNVIAGFDPLDSTSVKHAHPDFTADLNKDIKGLRIGIPSEFFGEGLDADIAKAVQDAIKELEKLGATIHEIHLPNNYLALSAYYVVAPAEASSNLARYDGVRYGYRCDNPKDLLDMYCRSRGEGFGTEVKRRILIGTYVLSSGFFDAYYVKAQKIRRILQQDFLQAFENVDVILGPTTPNVAFNVGEKSQDPISMYLSDIYTVAVNLAGLPAITVPAGFAHKLPVGMQMIGNYFSESKLLNIAHRYQAATEWHKTKSEVCK